MNFVSEFTYTFLIYYVALELKKNNNPTLGSSSLDQAARCYVFGVSSRRELGTT